MAKKKFETAPIDEFLKNIFEGEGTDEYVTDEATNLLGQLGSEAKVDMIAAGAVAMMKRLADKHGVHILDCMIAVPKWVSLLVANDIWNDVSQNRMENENDGQTEKENRSESQAP